MRYSTVPTSRHRGRDRFEPGRTAEDGDIEDRFRMDRRDGGAADMLDDHGAVVQNVKDPVLLGQKILPPLRGVRHQPKLGPVHTAHNIKLPVPRPSPPPAGGGKAPVVKRRPPAALC